MQVVAAADDADTADALRAAMPTVNPDAQVLAVISGDLVTDVRLSDVLATHVRGGAVATCLLAKRRAWNGVDMKVGRPPKGAHYVGLANDKLLLMADEEDVDKVLKLRRPMLGRVRDLVVHTDLLDAQLYVLDRAQVKTMLDDKPRMTSLQLDVIPALVRRQFRAQLAGSGRARTSGSIARHLRNLRRRAHGGGLRRRKPRRGPRRRDIDPVPPDNPTMLRAPRPRRCVLAPGSTRWCQRCSR